MTTPKHIPMSITRHVVEAKTRKLGTRWTIEIIEPRSIRHIEGRRFSIVNAPEIITWLNEMGYGYDRTQDPCQSHAYELRLDDDRSAAHFKLTFA